MKQTPPETIRESARQLNRLMHNTTRIRQVWCDQDYQAMLEHQLAASVRSDLEALFPEIRSLLPPQQDMTFRSALINEPVSLPVLKLIKLFAKHLRQNEEGGYPEEVALVLYYAALASATSYTHTNITSLSSQEITQGFRWSLNRPWLGPELRDLFLKAMPRESSASRKDLNHE